MPGTKAGGLKAAETNKKKYGENFYARIGAMGGQKGHTGGFAANIELARVAGRKGGLRSKRGIRMSDELRKAKQDMYYCRARLRSFEERLEKAKDDYDIQHLEINCDYWRNKLDKAEQAINKEMR